MTVIETFEDVKGEIEYAIRAFEAGNSTSQAMIARIRQILTINE